MKDVILLAIGFISGVLATIAFSPKVQALDAKVQTAVVGLLTKTAAKIGDKN